MKKMIFLIMFLTIANFASAEEVRLKSGVVKKGEIVEKTDQDITIKDGDKTFTIPFNMIAADQVDALKAPPGNAAKVSAAADQSSAGVTPGAPAAEIIQKTIAAYRAMKSYSSEGTVEDSIIMGGASQNMSKKFSIKLGKPNFYKVTWQDSIPNLPVQTGGVLWNAGDGAYLNVAGQTQKLSDDKMAIASATGVSGGAASLVPGLFLDIGLNYLTQIKNLKLVGSETVNGQECYVVSGEGAFSTEEKFWISKDKNLIVRNYHKIDQNKTMPEFTDEQMAAMLKSMNMEVNEENRAKVKKMMDMSKSALSQIQGGEHEENYRNIVIDADIAREEFTHEIPANVSQNAMSDVFKHLDGMNYSLIATQGSQLSAENAAALESKLASKPEDFETRIKLLGYYFAKHTPESLSKKLDHVQWVVQNRPDYPGGELIWPQLMLHPAIDGQKAYDQVKQLWLEQTRKFSTNAVVLRNAAGYFKVSDQALANELSDKADKIDSKGSGTVLGIPNPH